MHGNHVLVKNLKQHLNDALNNIEALGKNGQKTNPILQMIAEMREEVENENNPGTLFKMLQILREVAHKELGDQSMGTGFKVKMPDGKIKEFKNLEEWNEETGHISQTSQQFSATHEAHNNYPSDQRDDPRRLQTPRRRRRT